MRLKGHTGLQQPQTDDEGETRELGQPGGRSGQAGDRQGGHRQNPLARFRVRVRLRRLTQHGREIGELAVAAPSVRVTCNRPSERAASVSPNADSVADKPIE